MTHPWNPLLMFLIKTFIRNSKIVYLVHDANPHPGESNSKLQRFISNLEIKSANHILAHSEEVSNILKSRYQDLSVTKIPHPTYDFGEITTPRAISPTPTFLFFGRIVEYKGLTLLLDSFLLAQEKLRSQGKTIKLIIAGNGEINYTNLKKIKDYQQDIELINRYIDEEEITDIWQKSDICSLTYVEASQSGVIAIAVNQAMPCLITPIAGLEEQTLIDNEDKSFALMSKDLDPENIAETMIDILDENTYTKLSLNAIKHQKDLGWNKWLEVLDKILKD